MLSSLGPISTLVPIRLMWSVIAIRLPGPTSGRSEPAALVWTRISAPAAFSQRTGVRSSSIGPPS